MSAVRLVPREVQQRLDEPGDAELLSLLRAIRHPPAGQTWRAADDRLQYLYRTLAWDPEMYSRVLDRVRGLRAVVRAEERPP